MINAWSLLYDELYGDDEMTEDIKITTGNGNTTFNVPEDVVIEDIPEVVTGDEASDEVLTIDGGDTIDFNDFPTAFSTFADNDDSIAHHVGFSTDDFVNFDSGLGNTAYVAGVDTLNLDFSSCYNVGDDVITFTGEDTADTAVKHGELPKPGIELDNPRKYKEDESIKALQDYISTTYGGHYTSDNNNVQTLDLIESVGDAESFCRSNAIKYLSRYDKKGQAKRDILKALHYSLLLYHFSGQLNETTTRGYETF